jgi:hypothetical protein
MNPNPARKDQNYVGYGAYFEGRRLGTVTDDRLRPCGGRTTSRRVVTLDNGMALLDPTSERPRRKASSCALRPRKRKCATLSGQRALAPARSAAKKSARPFTPIIYAWSDSPCRPAFGHGRNHHRSERGGRGRPCILNAMKKFLYLFAAAGLLAGCATSNPSARSGGRM